MKKVFALAIVAALMTACGSVATPEWAAEAQGTQAALAVTSEHLTDIAPTATSTPTGAPTATPVPPTETPVPPTATNTPDLPTATFTPTAISVSVSIGDAAHGKELFNTLRSEVGFACGTCHYVDQETRLIGPGLLGLAERASSRVAGQSAYDYLHASIVNPNAYVVEADPPYPPGLMPQVYERLWSDEELNDIIAYLMTL